MTPCKTRVQYINKDTGNGVSFFKNIYLFLTERERERERERDHEWGRGRERGRQNLKQAPGSELSAQSLTWVLNSQTVRLWPELKSDEIGRASCRERVCLYV